MTVGIATGLLILLVIYFIWQTAQDQDLELEYSLYYSPRETVVETQLNVRAPLNDIWDVLTDVADYHHWFPWIRRVHVTNPEADRWVHRHSTDHFPIEVGNRFKIRPFLFTPLMTRCRFITVDPPNILSMEMRFFPLNREFVSFSLKPFKRHVEVTYRATRRGPLGFVTTTMFSWRGKNVLCNLAQRLPEIPFVPEEEKPLAQEAPLTMDEAFIDALVAKALSDGDDILTRIGDRPTRARAKSAYVKAKRVGKAPEAKEAAQAVERFLAGEQTPAAAKVEPAEKKTPEPAESRDSASSEDAIVDDAVKQALAGNMDPIKAISDRVVRARAKSAYMKAKRQMT